MPVDPHLQPVLDAMAQAPAAAPGSTPLDAARVGFEGNPLFRSASPAPVGAVTDLAIPTAHGAVGARTYQPDGPGPWPVIVFLHGGGWAFGSIGTHDSTAREVCHRAGALVLSVDYRLSPEHPFPAGLDDCVAAYRWTLEHAAELGGDPSRMALLGDSAGGNLAAATALRLRDEGVPQPLLQVLVYPVTDAGCATPSMEANAEGYFLTRSAMGWLWSLYLADPAHADDGYAAPLRAADVSGLAPALVVTAEYDPLRDEGEAYGRRLEEAGVPVTVSRYDGAIHGFFSMLDITPLAKQAHDEVAGALRAAFASG
jgi:acetyl esterase